MESAIRLCYRPLSSPQLSPFHGAKGSAYARSSGSDLKFNHATLSLSHFTTRHPVARSFGHVNCMLNNNFSVPPQDEGSDKKILRGVTGVSVVLACVVGLFNLSSKLNPKCNTAYAAWPFDSRPNTTMSMPHKLPGAEEALESLLKMIDAKQLKYENPPEFDGAPNKHQVNQLKWYAVGLSKSGKKGEAKALKILENEYNKYKDYNPEVEHNMGMAWIELLIFQGKYREASQLLDRRLHEKLSPDELNQQFKYEELKYNEEKICKLLKNYDEQFEFEKLSIAQMLLYKAIIQTMLENKEAAKWWEDLHVQAIMHVLKNKEAAKWWGAFIATL